MKRSKTSSRKALSGDRQLFARPSNQVRHRAATFKLESLEERTLLSVSPTGTAASPYVQTQFQVTGTSPAVGSVLAVPVTDLVVQFNEAFNAYTINSTDFKLSQGSVVSAVPLTPEAVDLTLSGVTHDGSLTLTVPAGVILDTLGVHNAAFSGTYVVDIVSEPYPTPLQAKDPAGSLIYDPSVSGSIGFVGDTDTYTLPLTAGQTLTLVMTTGSGLTGTVTLLGPGGNTIGTATGSGPGATVVLETAPVTTAGTYSLVASGFGGSTGTYTLQAILNAAYKPVTDIIDTIGTAYELTSAFTSLGTTPYADRAGVNGVLSSSPDYYAVPLTAGEVTSIAVKGNGGAASIALYDGSGNLLALSTSGKGVDGIISDFVAPSTGSYHVQVTAAASLTYDLVVTRGSDFDIHGNSYNNAQPLNGADVVLGLGGVSQDWYSFNVNAGDNLVITTTTPGATTASGLQFVNNLDPTINLYDASGNLVATATGNAADGRNSVIDFTALTPGSYRVQVLSTNDSLGEYTVSIQGATGAATPFNVTSTTPAAGADLGYQVSTMGVSVSDSIDLASVSTSDFTIDGNSATGVTVLDDHDLSFTFPTTADGVHNVSISGFSSTHGTLLTPDNFSFATDDVPPVVVSSSIVNGSVLSPGNLTEVVTFSKPIQPSSVSTADISLHGEIRGVDDYTPTISFDSTDTILTVNYTNLPTDAYQFTLLAGPAKFTSLAGVPLQDSYVVNFTILGGTSTISGLQPVLPLGSLVYQSTVDNVLLSSTDIDTYNLAIDPQQTLAVIVTPVTSSLTANVDLYSPTGNLLGAATSPSPGAPAILYGVQSSRGGTYQFQVSGGPGEYTIQPILNAYVDPAAYGGSTNTSIATATPIDPYGNNFIGQDNRTAVLGSIGGSPATFGDSLVVTSRDVILGEAPFPAPSDPVYSFALNQGESATIALQSLNGKNGSFTLYDDQGDVLGVSAPGATNYTAGLNDFVAPNDGTYYLQVSGDPSAQFNLVVIRGADFTTQDHTSPGDAQDITATQQSGDPKEGGALGYISSISSGPSTDYYSVNANAGDNLHFATSTPAGGPNEFVNTLNPELLLFDNNGNLVAIAAGNAADGRNSVIDYTVPDGGAGKWTIEVTSDDGSQGEYGLLATGATGSLSPFIVTGTTPPAGALVQPPSTITVTFNDPVLIASLTPGELEVNGVSATAVTDVNANTVSWTVEPSSYATGIDLPNTVTIGADAYGNQVTDVSGQTLTPYSYTFYTTNVAPYVVSSSIDGQIFSPAPADLTEVVTFSQPMNPTFTTASSFDLLGNYRNVQYAAASFSWDPTDTILTINYTNLPGDTYTLTLYASGFQNSVGIPLGSNHVANFAVALGTNITISGEKFNDLNGDGKQETGEPGLPGWTIDLLDATGAIVATTVTDANGDYSFSDVGPGTYTVQEELQPGWIQTYPAPPGTYRVTVTSGSDQTGLNFGNFQLVTFAGTVYNDLAGNGVLDPGDPGLQGWTVNLLDQNGNIVATTTSAGDGTYSFSNLGPGLYTIEEVNQNGWYQTQPVNPPGTYTVQAISSTNPSGLDFGNFQLVNVTGEVYNDRNGNGNLDQGETGLQGWTVLLLNPAGNTVATTTSDVNGNYEFDNLFPGTFTVEEILQAGWIQTQPVNPNYYQFMTQSGLNETGLDFGNFVNSENFSGTVYNDLAGNGVLDGSDYGLAGWTINVLNASNNVVASTTSDSSGNYSFTDLPVQQYTIEEIVQTGWTITQPTNPPGTYTLPAARGVYIGLDFGNFQLVTVSGNVYNDLNGNGTQDSGEPGLKNWTVDVINAGGTVVASAVSNAQGNYTIPNIGPGSYTVAEVVQSGWIQTQPLNPTYYSITTSSGTNIAGETFGNFKAVTVSGNVYNDLNGNGLHDAGEPGLSKWTVLLENSSGTVIASVKSDVNGNYTFTGVGGGTYEVAEVVQTNWVQTQPLYPTVHSFTTKSGTNLLALNFGDHYSPALSPSAVIDNGQPGYSEAGSWSTVGGGFNGTNRVAKTVHAGGPKATAAWNFSSISPGLYDVYVTFAGKNGYSSAAPYTVYNGSTKLGTVDINQSILVTQSQGGLIQGSYGGVGWLELGIFAISSKDLQVVLSNQASGNFVDADGVLLVPQGGAGVHGGSGPATVVGPNSAVGANSTNSSVSIGTLKFDSTAPSTNGNGQQSQVISLSGVSHAALSVIYNQGSQPVVNQSSPSLVDAVIGLGTSNSNGSSSNDAITALAQSLISGKNNS